MPAQPTIDGCRGLGSGARAVASVTLGGRHLGGLVPVAAVLVVRGPGQANGAVLKGGCCQ